jgi:hypothetical protein
VRENKVRVAFYGVVLLPTLPKLTVLPRMLGLGALAFIATTLLGDLGSPEGADGPASRTITRVAWGATGFDRGQKLVKRNLVCVYHLESESENSLILQLRPVPQAVAS